MMNTTCGLGVMNSENARLVTHVSFSPAGSLGDLETVDSVEQSLREAPQNGTRSLQAGYALKPVGSFQNQIDANQSLMWLISFGILVSWFIIYLQFRLRSITLAAFAGIPVAFTGVMIYLAINPVEINTAVGVGFIALFGIPVEDGMVMSNYLNRVFPRKHFETIADIRNATVEADM